MIEYELINPSDPYTFLAKTKESAALAVFLLGTMYGASPKDDNEEKRIPVFLFGGAEEWYRKEFGRSTEAGLKAEKQNVADALLSFMYGSFEDRRRYKAALNAITDEEKKKVFMEEWQDGRTSMKNIGEYAHQLGEKWKEGYRNPTCFRQWVVHKKGIIRKGA